VTVLRTFLREHYKREIEFVHNTCLFKEEKSLMQVLHNKCKKEERDYKERESWSTFWSNEREREREREIYKRRGKGLLRVAFCHVAFFRRKCVCCLFLWLAFFALLDDGWERKESSLLECTVHVAWFKKPHTHVEKEITSREKVCVCLLGALVVRDGFRFAWKSEMRLRCEWKR